MTERVREIQEHIIKQLKDGLPVYLTYHSLDHTLYVLKVATYLAQKEGLSAPETELLQVAALYHDIGFTVQREEHEEVGCKIATGQLAAYGFTIAETKEICGMIRATRIPQKPHTLSECILADADLEYLSTSLFWSVGDLLYQELKHINPRLTRRAWDEIQIQFLESHQYHTVFCQKYKESLKQQYLRKLKEQYAETESLE